MVRSGHRRFWGGWMGQEMRNLGRCVGLAPLQGKKKPSSGKILREAAVGKGLNLPVWREAGPGHPSVRGAGESTLHWLSHPHKCPGCVFPLRPSLWQFGFIWDAFTFVAFLQGRRLQGLGGNPASHSPSPRHGQPVPKCHPGKEEPPLFLSSSSSSSSSSSLL